MALSCSPCREKLSKKVQFLQPNNDDMMKKVYAMAWRYMNCDANDFSSVWTKAGCIANYQK
jgi:hypothetical protein